MKNRYDRYQGLTIDSEQPDSILSDNVNFFQRMVVGDRFRFLFIKKFDCGYFADDSLVSDNPLSAKILSVTSTPDGLVMRIDTQGEVTPPGIKHGQYTLKFADDSLVCDDLPDEMFEE